MQNLGTFFFWALAACILFDGSFAKSPRFGYTILLDDISPNQSELRSLLSDFVQDQDQGNTSGTDIVTKVLAKLDSVADQQAKLEEQLRVVEAEMEGQLQEGQNRMKEWHAELEKDVLWAQNMLESGLEFFQFKIENQLLAVSKKIDAAAKVKTEVHPIFNKTAAPQQAVPPSAPITIPSGFEIFGTRYFRIVNEFGDWDTAERRCREMGGYLASFRNEEEFNAIKPELKIWKSYWLGINDRENEGHFVSVASQKPAPFLEWLRDEPNDRNHVLNCVYLYNGRMGDAICNAPCYFICQADNET